jgi:hypothetical protein
MFAHTAIALILLSQAPVARGRIEGIVLQAGGAAPQPVAGARITVTKVNGATGANLPILGAGASPSVAESTSSTASFPGMPTVVYGADGLPRLQTVPGPAPQTTLPIPSVTTERDGKFVVPDLEQGTYRLLITQSGYVRQEFGQLINLTAGQALNNLTIRLTPTGNVGGRIMDNNGQPAVGVNLQLLKATYNANGQRIFQNAGSARTNDRGEYRFFWVTPGRYYVAGGNAAATFTFGGGTGPNDPGDSYLLTYYPGVTDINRAAPVDVKPGSELAADFVTPKQRLYTVSGKVVGQAPAVTLSLAFRLLTGGAGVFTMFQAYDPAAGTFVMRNVLPGSYLLQAAAPPSYSRVPLEVSNSDIEGLVVTVTSSLTVTGRFAIENGDTPFSFPPFIAMRPMTNGLPDYLAMQHRSSEAAADGSFAISNVIPGQYRVVVPSAQNYYVKEVRYNRADVLNSPFEVSSNNLGTMEVVIGRNVGQIDGSIVDDRGNPVSGVQAVLIPDTRERAELYRTATTDQSGRFTMRNIAPGDYKLFAWEALDNFGYFDPDVIRRSESLGKAVRVAESSKLSVDGKLIPASP